MKESFRKVKALRDYESKVFFSIWVFFQKHSRIIGLRGKGEGISLTHHYHFHPIHRHLDISRAITGESSPLHIVSNRTRIRNLWFSSAPNTYSIFLITFWATIICKEAIENSSNKSAISAIKMGPKPRKAKLLYRY